MTIPELTNDERKVLEVALAEWQLDYDDEDDDCGWRDEGEFGPRAVQDALLKNGLLVKRNNFDYTEHRNQVEHRITSAGRLACRVAPVASLPSPAAESALAARIIEALERELNTSKVEALATNSSLDWEYTKGVARALRLVRSVLPQAGSAQDEKGETT